MESELGHVGVCAHCDRIVHDFDPFINYNDGLYCDGVCLVAALDADPAVEWVPYSGDFYDEMLITVSGAEPQALAYRRKNSYFIDGTWMHDTQEKIECLAIDWWHGQRRRERKERRG